MMCSRRTPDSTGSISNAQVLQLEWSWEPDAGKTWFDVSNVAGRPFVNEGLTLYVSEERTEASNTCAGRTCAPGDGNCGEFYEGATDDVQGMRACSDNVDLEFHLCLYDASLPEYGPPS
jgi:hypothetical protein